MRHHSMAQSLGLCVLVLVGFSWLAPAASVDPKANEVAERLLNALGGKENWEKARYLRFDFAVERDGKTVAEYKHLWDRYTGRYRVEGKTKENQHYVVLFKDINAKKGSAYLDGKQVNGAKEKELLDDGYGRFINDTYWLIMPYKWKDPGVNLKYEGIVKGPMGEVWDKVLLTFEGVGLTPKDRYWAFVNQKTGLMDRWEFILKGGSGPATVADWTKWQNFGGILLSTEKPFKGQKLRILFNNVAVSSSIDEKPFTDSAAIL